MKTDFLNWIKQFYSFLDINRVHSIVFINQVFCISVWYPTTVSTATAVLRYNLAVAYAIQGKLEKSGETLKQVSTFSSTTQTH